MSVTKRDLVGSRKLSGAFNVSSADFSINTKKLGDKKKYPSPISFRQTE